VEEKRATAFWSLFAVGIVLDILVIGAWWQEGGRLSVMMLMVYPVVLGGIGAAIDSKRNKRDGKNTT
jgi:hypothetical protein